MQENIFRSELIALRFKNNISTQMNNRLGAQNSNILSRGAGTVPPHPVCTQRLCVGPWQKTIK